MDFTQLLCVFSKISLARRISHSVSASITKGWGSLNSQSMTVVLMKTSNGSNYGNTYFGGNPDLPIVCEVTPMVTTVKVRYYENGLINVTRVLVSTLLPDDSWPLAWYQGFVLWSMYFFSQGPYSNSLADDLDLYLGSDVDVMQALVSKC